MQNPVEAAESGRRRAEVAAAEREASLRAALELEPAAFVDAAARWAAELAADPAADAVLERIPFELFTDATDRLIRDAGDGDRSRVAEWLDPLRRPGTLRRIGVEDRPAWAERIERLVERSRFTLGPLFRQRARRYAPKTLFETPGPAGPRPTTWRQAAARIDWLSRGLHALADAADSRRPVALLTENRLDGALVDLACLTAGIPNVLIPANSTHRDVRYMLEHSGSGSVVVSTASQWSKVQRHRSALPRLEHAFILDAPPPGAVGLRPIDALVRSAESVSPDEVRRRSEAVGLDDRATVMYTSGTTGEPKGICFTQRNLVMKRFARALALPEIGDEDVLVSYLPLYHTFGRYLEMLGCVFWGATYCFVPDPSIESLIGAMRRHRPTVFISIPKKWLELHDAAHEGVRPGADPDRVVERVRSLTGGRLRWGLSAAGHLDSEVFRFFQEADVELMSGFGMTEATGGITMTPPGEYRDDSLGLPLPAIETRLADDGELWIRGPYVMEGYLDPPDGETGFDADGWFATGDLMEIDADGHFRLIDRKKEIYKNIRGETVAPQRIERLFRDFESVGRVFLVGDHRPYNTVLIHPNPAFEALPLKPGDPATIEHFRSVVTSVNQFLSPFERIVDFALIDRDLDPELGELTAKGTPRRKTVERNFRETIGPLYRRATLTVGGAEIQFPNWLLQALGATTRDLVVEGDRLLLPGRSPGLSVRRRGRGVTQVGSFVYRHRPGALPIGGLVSTPRLWLGNEELKRFLALDLTPYQRGGRDAESIRWRSRRRPRVADGRLRRKFEQAREKADPGLEELHVAALLLASDDEAGALDVVDWLERRLRPGDSSLAEPMRVLLRRTARGGTLRVRRRAFEVLVRDERQGRFRKTARYFFATPGRLLDRATRRAVAARNLSTRRIESLLGLTVDRLTDPAAGPGDRRKTIDLLHLLAEYGATHPTRYRRIRAFLERAATAAPHAELGEAAAAAAQELTDGFRRWLGPVSRLAVDPEDGTEYEWEDVVAFDTDVPLVDRRRLLSAITETGMLREAVFLFSGGALIRLSDIPEGGVWVRLLAARHGKSVYRITIQTRWQGAFDVAVNVNQSLPADYVREEIHWLIVCGGTRMRPRLVEDFGGYWPEHDLWTEEYISGESLDAAMRRLSRRDDGGERLRQTWPFFAWTTLAACIDFWDRSERRFELSDASLQNVIAPTHDYHLGARLVSLTGRRPHGSAPRMLRTLWDGLVLPAEERYPDLAGVVSETIAFSAWVEVLGADEGVRILEQWLGTRPEELPERYFVRLKEFLDSVRRRGFLPLRLYFAAKRYRRWAALAPEAPLEARAETLADLYETYRLQALQAVYPASRVRFFLETVFRDGDEDLVRGLEKLVEELRAGTRHPDELIEGIADLRSGLAVDASADYFLTRLGFPHLGPKDAATFEHVVRGGRSSSEIVVRLEDAEGRPFRIRHAMTPKEVGKLQRLFLDARLDVRFLPEHRFLVAINERNQLIGGIFYDLEDEGETAHLEKIVVADRFRKLGVADALMNEFFNRLRAMNVETVTTGYFRPEFFYRHGFRIGKRSAGLMRRLDEPEAPRPSAAEP